MDKMLDKIRKLLELSKHNSNVHEASAAAARAQALMEEHRITEAMIDAMEVQHGRVAPTEEIVLETLEEGTKRYIDPWKWQLAQTLCYVNGCEYIEWQQKNIRHMRILGHPSDIQTVRYLFQYLTLEILRLCQEGAKDELEAMSDPEGDAFLRPEKRGDELLKWRNSFKLGAKDEICKRLGEAKRAAREAVWKKATDMVLVRDAMAIIDNRHEAVKKDLERRKFGKSKASQGARSNADAYGAGRRAGATVELSNGRGLNDGGKRLK